MKILRGLDPGPFSGGNFKRLYKPFLRSLFGCRCAYCHRHDDCFGGEDAATVDRFKPEERFSALRFEWSNLYYACHLCNCHYKRHFPSVIEEAEGKRFVDPCAEDPDNHFRIALDALTGDFSHVRFLSEAGKYTVFRLKLNDRKDVRDYCRVLDRNERQLARRLQEIDQCLRHCDDIADPQILPVRRDYETQRKNFQNELERVRSLRPFPIDA